MRLVSVAALEEKIKLAKSVLNDKGRVLISEGVPLTTRMIYRLTELGITYVYIDDDKTRDIDSKDVLSETTRTEAMTAIGQAFDFVQDEQQFAKAFSFGNLGKKFTNLVLNILDEVREHKEAISLLANVYTQDQYILTHSLNVTIYSLALGLNCNLTEKQLRELGLGAMLHDVGKQEIPPHVLQKPGRLTDQEFKIIKEHAERGFNILRQVPTIPLICAHCAFQHHERLDGSGYPRGISGEQIHLYGRIIGIADVYDAVTSNRVYRSAMLPHEGLEILYTGAGTKFDKQMVEIFRRSIALYPVGLTVVLSNGTSGVVVRQNDKLNERPIIRISAEKGEEIAVPYELDLSQEPSIMITHIDTTLLTK